MNLAIDIGGTKTLLAVFDDQGTVLEERRFPTPHDYSAFLTQVKTEAAALEHQDYETCVAAVPGLLDRTLGIARAFGNLSWVDVPIRDDLAKAIGKSVRIENDAKLAALSEAICLKDEFARALYITISTGIGIGLVIDGRLDEGMINSEGGQILVEHQGSLVTWEDVASGRAIVERFGKRASDIDDPAVWQTISHDIAIGLINLIATIQPEVFILGGGVGTHFKKFEASLLRELQKYETPMVPLPVLRQAQRAEKAVIYGCIELLKQ